MHRGPEEAAAGFLSLLVMSSGVETSLALSLFTARDSSTSVGMTE
jgi:hypothetical protein